MDSKKKKSKQRSWAPKSLLRTFAGSKKQTGREDGASDQGREAYDDDSRATSHDEKTPTTTTKSATTTTTTTKENRGKSWLQSFSKRDPRYQILQFYETVVSTQDNIDDATADAAADTAIFTVWRPTSSIAIQRMITGEATGKGLEIKGKSSKAGQLSGFVPYLQIHDNDREKTQIRTLPKNGRTRIFFRHAATRDAVLKEQLEPLQNQIVNIVHQAKRTVKKTAVLGILKPLEHSWSKASSQVSTVKSELKNTRLVKSADDAVQGLRDSAETAVTGLQRSAIVERISGLKQKSSGSKDNVVSGLGSPVNKGVSGIGSSVNKGVSEIGSSVNKGLSSLRINKDKNNENREEDDEEREWALKRLLWDMDDPSVRPIDDYAPDCYGIELPDRLLWRAFVADRDISRPPDSKFYTGRPSQPAFQDMNHIAIYKTRKHQRSKHKDDDDDDDDDEPRVVLWQTLCDNDTTTENNEDDPMDPRGLIMAYEEKGRVLPVVSDFDCFTMGTKGMQFKTPLPKEQVELLQWCVSRVEYILDENNDGTASWTSCWLDVLKASASKGFHPTMPRFGFGDEKSYGITESAVGRLKDTGAQRHGSESQNYYFPQELDDEFLVVSGSLPGNVSWKYVNVGELLSFLHEKVDEGFTFPLNPKWILCDNGWKALYDHLSASQKPYVQDSLNVWFPPSSGVRETMNSILARHPSGFICDKRDPELCGTEAMDLATMELDSYLALRRAKSKLRAVMAFNSLLQSIRRRRNATTVEPVSENRNDGRLRKWFSGQWQSSELPRILLLDGGVSTHLEEKLSASNRTFPYRELWSSGLLLSGEGRSQIYESHVEWLSTGANVVSTVTYQCHYEASLWPKETESLVITDDVMDMMWKDGIGLARKAVVESDTDTPVFLVASSGCYGAALANGAEYTGDYGEKTIEELQEFHRRKMETAVALQPDGIAFETIPSLQECRALSNLLLSELAGQFLGDSTACYVSFSCQNSSELNDGTLLQNALAVLRDIPVDRLQGIGLNCCDARHLPGLLTILVKELAGTDTPRAIVVYPNSGETWDAATETWVAGTGITADSEMAATLMQMIHMIESTWRQHCKEAPLPSILIGGCCRTKLATISALRKLVDEHLSKEES